MYDSVFDILLKTCADLTPQETLLIVSDSETEKIGTLLYQKALAYCRAVTHETISNAEMHGAEPPASIAAQMLRNNVIIGLTKTSMAHTQARFKASLNGAKYLSLPDYSFEMLKNKAFEADFRGLTQLSKRFAEIFTEGRKIILTTALGTQFSMKIEGRIGNAAPGWCYSSGTIASPPDAESNVALIEDATEGLLVVDGSIPCREIGLLREPVKLFFEKGRVTDIKGPHRKILTELFDKNNNPLTRIAAEFGIGLNPLAQLSGLMLEDEGCLSTVHIGIGANDTIGGKNQVPFHLDFVVKNACVRIDEKMILKDGKFLI